MKPPLPRLLFLSGPAKLCANVSLSIQTKARGIYPTSFMEPFRYAACGLVSEPDSFLDPSTVGGKEDFIQLGPNKATRFDLAHSIRYHINSEYPYASAFLLFNRIREEAEYFNSFLVEDALDLRDETEIAALECTRTNLFKPEEISVLFVSDRSSTIPPPETTLKNIPAENQINFQTTSEPLSTEALPYELPSKTAFHMPRRRTTTL